MRNIRDLQKSYYAPAGLCALFINHGLVNFGPSGLLFFNIFNVPDARRNIPEHLGFTKNYYAPAGLYAVRLLTQGITPGLIYFGLSGLLAFFNIS